MEQEAKYERLDLKGLPHISVLSLTLYSLYMAGLNSKSSQNCKLKDTDDAVFYSGKKDRIVALEVEKSIQSVAPLEMMEGIDIIL
jgi:hypothetical protein